jgi:pimeloyl-ACP methyl ester carboxylesterase
MSAGKAVVLFALATAILFQSSMAYHIKPDPNVNLAKKTDFFESRVDHFDALNEKTYRQMYWVEDSFAVNKQSPVFFFLGGEAPLGFFDFQEVSALEWAKQNKAYYIALEHRYYGVSNPVPDLSTHNMRYLSSEQALADAAVFVETMQKTYTGPWVVFGCSYSGSLSAWFRLKYPHLVIGSVAPSGPVIPQANFTQFFNNFQHVAGRDCVQSTTAAVNQINTLYGTAEGRVKLTNDFNSCKPLEAKDEFMFKWTITEFLATTAQWQNPPGNQLDQACGFYKQTPADPVKAWGNAYTQMNNAPAPPSCTDFTQEAFLAPLRQHTLGNIDRAWYFQKCTEFGFFQVGYPKSSIFFGDMTLEKVNFCKHIFGINNMAPNTEWTKAEYGALKLKGTDILFTNGLYDPWHTISITHHTAGVEAITYEAAHCAPMTAPTPNDPPSLTEARARVASFLSKLLARAGLERSAKEEL